MSALSQFSGGGIRSIQRGTITVTLASGAGSGTATISSVNTSRSTVELLGVTPDSQFSALAWGRVTLTNSTTVTANAAGGSDRNITVGYQVVEYF